MSAPNLPLLLPCAIARACERPRRGKVFGHVLFQDVLIRIVRGLPLRLVGIDVEVIWQRLGFAVLHDPAIGQACGLVDLRLFKPIVRYEKERTGIRNTI
jgi:hypothetical protein